MANAGRPAEIEFQIAQAVTAFARDHLGRGPKQARAYVLEDTVLVRCHGPLTILESRLAAADEPSRSSDQVRALSQLIDLGRKPLLATVERQRAGKTTAVLSDVPAPLEESVFVFLLEDKATDGQP